jgi:Xaa-Pro aminopeptidase
MSTDLVVSERDRRWATVRESAASAGLDGLLVPIGNGSDSRYLTLIRGAVIVIPAGGGDPVVVMDQGQSNSWVPEPRSTVRSWGRPMVEAVQEAGLGGGRIGVAGLGPGRWSHVTAGDGVVTDAPFRELLRSLPRATFVDATDLVGCARAAKSAAEIALLQESSQIAESGLARLRDVAVAGAPEASLHAAVIKRILAFGSEYRPHEIAVDGNAEPQVAHRLTMGQVITATVSGAAEGYTVAETDSVIVGAEPPYWAAQRTAFREALTLAVKSVSVRSCAMDIVDAVDAVASRSPCDIAVHVEGLGIGDDGPFLTPDRESREARTLPFVPGQCLSVTLRVSAGGHRQPYIGSCSIAISDGIGVPLSDRHELMV